VLFAFFWEAISRNPGLVFYSFPLAVNKNP